MKAPPLAKNYSLLTPEERFRLILAASGRGDEAERDRLARTADRINLSMQHHAPWMHAFSELSLFMFIELLEEAACYLNSFRYLHSKEQEGSDEDDGELDPEEQAKIDEMIHDVDVTLALGYWVRAKAEGWKYFCEKLNIPPFLLWEDLPGFGRLQSALDLAKKTAFTPEGIVKWLNRVRPAGTPELTRDPLPADELAKATEEAFRQRVQWWGG
jgi:hypothetical protein